MLNKNEEVTSDISGPDYDEALVWIRSNTNFDARAVATSLDYHARMSDGGDCVSTYNFAMALAAYKKS
jgi:hypothetical protein